MDSITVFFVSNLLLLLIIYGVIFYFFFDKRTSKFNRVFNTLIITGGLFIANYIAFEALSGLKETDYSIWFPIGITVIMYWMRNFLVIFLKPTLHFISHKDENQTSIIPKVEYKKVHERDSDKIGIYPRITIHDSEITDWKNPNHILFDSSDFVVINRTFGSLEGLQESFQVGTEIKFNDAILLTEKVKVDFLCIYDDYSGHLGHTDVYEGEDTPYNIQIVVFARKLKKQK